MAEHVLIIEDDEPLAAMLSEYLGSYGFAVTARPLRWTGYNGYDTTDSPPWSSMSCCQIWMVLKCVAASVPSLISPF